MDNVIEKRTMKEYLKRLGISRTEALRRIRDEGDFNLAIGVYLNALRKEYGKENPKNLDGPSNQKRC